MEWRLIYRDGKTLWRRTLESGTVEEREATPDGIDAAEALLDQQGWEQFDRDVARDMAPGGRYYKAGH